MSLSVGPMTTKKKVAIGVAVASAAVAAVGVAGYLKGKKTDAFISTQGTDKKLGFFKTILEGLKAYKDQVVGFFSKKGKKPADAAGKAADNAERSAEAAK